MKIIIWIVILFLWIIAGVFIIRKERTFGSITAMLCHDGFPWTAIGMLTLGLIFWPVLLINFIKRRNK